MYEVLSNLLGFRYFIRRKKAKAMPIVIRAVGQLQRNMAVTERKNPSRLSHLL